MDSKNYITPQGLARLKAEAQRLFSEERPKLVETIAWAASNGDRSENADYIYGKRRLREIDSRLQWLGKRIEAAEVVDPTQIHNDRVVFGATVELERDEESHKTKEQSRLRVSIVGEDETAPDRGLISWKSPLAKALLGKKEGDEIELKKPQGEEFFTIERIQYIPIEVIKVMSFEVGDPPNKGSQKE